MAALLPVLCLLVFLPSTAAAGPSVKRTLSKARAAGDLSAGEHRRYKRLYSAASRSAKRMRGPGAANLRGAVRTARSLAARRMLGARIEPVFATIRRNYYYFAVEGRPPVAAGTRERFGKSRIIWQFFPGYGWQIHPLANYSKLHAWAKTKRVPASAVRSYANELMRLVVRRRGFQAVEYYFPYGGGRAGWVSGMASAQAMRALARVSRRAGNPRYRRTARRMIGVFRHSPPWGVRLRRGRGRDHYLLYSHKPTLLVGNAFAQALIGLHDYAKLSRSSRARRLFTRGNRQLRSTLRLFDTRAWSRYSHSPSGAPGRESTLSYHRLFAGMLGGLCKRGAGRPYCRKASRFRRYERTPTRIGKIGVANRRSRSIETRFRIDKRSTVTVSLYRKQRRISRPRRVVLPRGRHRVSVNRPPGAGIYRAEVRAVSPSGRKARRATAARLPSLKARSARRGGS